MKDKLKDKLKEKSRIEIIKAILSLFSISHFESLLASNWFNPIASLWLNFRSFPLAQAYRLPIFVYGRPRLYSLSGKMRIVGKTKIGMIKFNKNRPGAPSLQSIQSELVNNGLILFNGHGEIGTGNKIYVGEKALLEIGNNFQIADFINIGCSTKISIGEQSRIAHRCQIFDSNYHFIANFSKQIIPNRTHPIKIGKGCWICNSTTISGGAIISKFTIVASNSLVNKDFSNLNPGSLIGGSPAKFITKDLWRVENNQLSTDLYKYYLGNSSTTYSIPNNITEKICRNLLSL